MSEISGIDITGISCRDAGKSIIGGGGRYSYIHVLHHLFPLKAIVFTVCEHEYMNISPPPPIIDFPASLGNMVPILSVSEPC
jgi:hypothetical protein